MRPAAANRWRRWAPTRDRDDLHRRVVTAELLNHPHAALARHQKIQNDDVRRGRPVALKGVQARARCMAGRLRDVAQHCAYVVLIVHDEHSLSCSMWECDGRVRRQAGFDAAIERPIFEEFGLEIEQIRVLEVYELHLPKNRRQHILPGLRCLCMMKAGIVRLNKRKFSPIAGLPCQR
jgi:hypothetical protein